MPQPPCAIEIRISRSLTPEAFLDSVDAYDHASGGTCRFVGHTRAERHETFGALMRLHYEAHEALAARRLEQHAETVAESQSLRRIVILHALGPIDVGRPSVLVSVTAPHRVAAFTACRQLIDRLKADVPIWKREVWESGSSWSPGTSVAADPETRP